MKNFKIILFLLAFSAGALTMVSCESTEKEQSEETTTEADNSEAKADDYAYTAAYVCPMHCEGSGSSEMGTCPACGMDYIARADNTTGNNKHDNRDH